MKGDVIKEVVVPIYGTSLTIFVCKSVGATLLEFKKSFEMPHIADCHACVAKSLPDSSFAVGVFLPRQGLTHGVIMHEVWHAVGYIMQRIGHPASYDDEPFAYLAQWICTLIYETLDSTQITPTINV